MIWRTLHTLFVIAHSTFVENVRDKVLYGILVFAFLFTTFTLFLGSISLGENLHVVRSMGLAGMYLFGLLVTIFLATALVFKELEHKTVYFILSKPVSRWQMVVGKFGGLFASVALSVVGMLAVYLAVVWHQGGGFDHGALVVVLYQLFELALIISLSIFFSTYARPLASVVYVVLFLYIGHSLGLLLTIAKDSAILNNLSVGLYYVLPNLEKFNVREIVLHGSLPSPEGTAAVFVYAVLYVALLLVGASVLLGRREL